MKLFAIYARVVLDEDLALNVFRQKYHGFYDPHVTLTQPRFISEEDIPEVRRILSSFFRCFKVQNHRIDLIFDTLVPEETASEHYSVMIGHAENKVLLNLQKNLIFLLSHYTNYCNQKTKRYEEHFRPHITIGLDLDKETYAKALHELGDQYRYKGAISEIVLSIVNEDTVEESKILEHITVFKL